MLFFVYLRLREVNMKNFTTSIGKSNTFPDCDHVIARKYLSSGRFAPNYMGFQMEKSQESEFDGRENHTEANCFQHSYGCKWFASLLVSTLRFGF